MRPGLDKSAVRACLPSTLAVFAAACAVLVLAGVPGLYQTPDGRFTALGISDSRRTSTLAPPTLMLLVAAAATAIPLAFHVHTRRAAW